jgi:hypothetical protein
MDEAGPMNSRRYWGTSVCVRARASERVLSMDSRRCCGTGGRHVAETMARHPSPQHLAAFLDSSISRHEQRQVGRGAARGAVHGPYTGAARQGARRAECIRSARRGALSESIRAAYAKGSNAAEFH